MEKVFANKSNEWWERLSKVMEAMSFPRFKKFLRDSLRIAIKPKSVYNSMVLAREVWYLIHFEIGKRHKIEASYITMQSWQVESVYFYYIRILKKVSSWIWLLSILLRWEDKKKLVTKKLNKILYNLIKSDIMVASHEQVDK